MAWIESHQTLSRHRKTLKTAGRLSVDRHKLIGHLHELWWWGLDNVGVSGVIENSTSYEIAAAAQWDGDPDAFVEALIYGGFIDRDGDKLQLHDWYEYAGQLIEKRIEERDRSRRRREEKKNQGATGGQPPDAPDGDRGSDQGATDGRPTATVPSSLLLPPLTPPNGGEDGVVSSVVSSVVSAWEQATGELIGDPDVESFLPWFGEHNMDIALMPAAVETARKQKRQRRVAPSYVAGVLRNWHAEGITRAEHLPDNRNAREPTPNARTAVAEQKLTAAQIELYKRAEAGHRTAS